MASSAHGVDWAGSHTDRAVFCPAVLLESGRWRRDARYLVEDDMVSHHHHHPPRLYQICMASVSAKVTVTGQNKWNWDAFRMCAPVNVFH